MSSSQKTLVLLAFIALLALMPPPISAQETDVCTPVAAGATVEVSAFMVCRRVTNNTAHGVCATTNIMSEEWSSFYDNPPGGIDVNPCVDQCTGGVMYNFACYRAGTALGESCDTVCASYGGCNLAGTRAIGDLDALGLDCTLVSLQLGYVNLGLITDAANAAGCQIREFLGELLALRRGTATTTCSAAQANAYRICACDN
ncbi:MAG: hypothetical protein AB7G06_02500 [Bdellovibrionales bacterium]